MEMLKNERVNCTFQDKLKEKLRRYETVRGEVAKWRQFKISLLVAVREECGTCIV